MTDDERDNIIHRWAAKEGFELTENRMKAFRLILKYAERRDRKEWLQICKRGDQHGEA